MSPNHLKREAYRLKNEQLPRQEINTLLTTVHSSEHERTGKRASTYDFRLCVSSASDSTWFNSDGKVGYRQGYAFLLSATERAGVLRMFKDLDSVVYPLKK
jgi:hypothetical protein